MLQPPPVAGTGRRAGFSAPKSEQEECNDRHDHRRYHTYCDSRRHKEKRRRASRPQLAHLLGGNLRLRIAITLHEIPAEGGDLPIRQLLRKARHQEVGGIGLRMDSVEDRHHEIVRAGAAQCGVVEQRREDSVVGAFTTAPVAGGAIGVVELRARHLIRVLWQLDAANAADGIGGSTPCECRAGIGIVVQRRHSFYICRNRTQVVVVQMAQAMVDRLGHWAGRLRLVGRAPGAQVVDQLLLAPAADPLFTSDVMFGAYQPPISAPPRSREPSSAISRLRGVWQVLQCVRPRTR